MPDALNILPNDTTFAGLDFQELRRKGLDHIARFSGNLWTDHNLHDPGITILEVLCYALADIGYRTRLPIDDLLARDPADKRKDDNFFTPAEILTNNPLTIDDYRKMLLDIPGVRNAWLEIADRSETDLYVDCAFNQLRFTDLPGVLKKEELEKLECEPPAVTPFFKKLNPKPLRRLELNGLYKVYLELEQNLPRDPATAACSGDEETFERILTEARQKLHGHRNLCEDFVDVIVLKDEQIAVCGDVELTPDAEPEKVLADLFEAIREFLSPSIPFYTLDEMLQRGKSIEEIFEGRPMTLDSHGFIDPGDLEKLKRHTEIHASDVYRVMMEVKGVRAVKRLYLLNFLDGAPQTTGEQWCLRLTPLHHPVLSPERSGLNFHKGVLTIPVDKKRVIETLGKRLSNFNKVKKKPEDLDGAVPKGRHRPDLGAYRSIIHEFPVTYAIGERQLSDRATALRKAQVRQLQGYLLFYDQLLANYLGQLSHLRNLFSLRPDCPANGTEPCPENDDDLRRPLSEQRSYFDLPLSGVPDADQLFRYFSLTPQNPPKKNSFSLNQILALGWNHEGGSLTSDIFQTLEDRDAALLRLQKVFDNGQAVIKTAGEENEDGDQQFRFTVEDNLGRQLLRSYALYPSKQAALLVAEELKLLGTMPQVYRKQDNQKKSQYRFQLVFNPLDYAAYLRDITENRKLYLQRRDKMLTHLLARFAEQFTDYVLLMYALNRKRYDPERIVEDKAYFLSNYPNISRNRGAASNYIDENEIWDTPNVSGLERRVTSLMGIRDWKRRNLSNFEVVERTDRYRPAIKDHRGCLIFISHAGYPTTDAADAAWKALVDFAKKEENYRCFDCSADSVYGFELVDDENCPVASHPIFYPTPQKRDAAKKCIREWIAADFLPTGIGTSKEGFYFTLDDAEGKRLLESPDPFASEDEAWAAWFEFIEAAQDKANYRLRQDPVSGGYYFLVGKMAGNEFVTLAVHRSTAPEKEMKLKMEQAAVFIQKKYAQPVLDGGEERFGWELFDGEGKPLMHCHLDRKDPPELLGRPGNRYVFKNRRQAVAALVEALDAACTPGNFIRAGIPAEQQFFFRLEKEKDLAVARSEDFTETTLRERAIENIQSFAGEWRGKMLETLGGFSFQLYNGADPDQKWLDGDFVFREMETALQEGEAAVVRVCQSDALTIARDEGFCAYRIELADACGERIAVSPNYSSLDEAKRELHKIVTAAQKGRLGVAANPVAGAFGAVAQAPQGEVLLRSYRLFASETDALVAWLDLHEQGQSYGHFEKTDAGNCDFSFLLTDECGRTLGITSEVFDSEEARNCRIEELVCYFSQHPQPFATASVTAPVRFLVKGKLPGREGLCTLMEGARWYDEAFEAKRAYWRFLCPAGDPGNYRPLPDPDGCRFGFLVAGEDELPLATHPVFYPKEKESLDKQDAIQTWMREHCYAFDVRLMPGKWFMQVLWRDCDGCCRPLLVGPERDTEAEAQTDLDQLKTLLPNNFELHKYVDETTQLPSFYLTQKGETLRLAWHPGGFIDECLRDSEMADVEAYLENVEEALVPCYLSALVCEKEFVTGSAGHPRTYSLPGARNLAIKEIFNKLKDDVASFYSSVSELEKDVVLENAQGTFQFSIKDGRTRKTLWISWETFAKKEEALLAYEAEFLKIIALAREGSNYRKQDDPTAPLQVQLADENNQAIAQIPTNLLTAANLNGLVQERIDHALKYPFFLENGKVRFRLFDLSEQRVYFVSLRAYLSLKRAKEGFTTFRRLLPVLGNWVPTTVTVTPDPNDPNQDTTRYGFTLQQNARLYAYRLRRPHENVAVHPIRYKHCNARDEALEALWQSVKKGAGHLYTAIREAGDLVFKAKKARPERTICDEPAAGLYHYRIIDDETGNVLWISWKGYASEAEARQAFFAEYLDVIALARRKPNYLMPAPADDPKTLLLLNEKGKPVAEIPPAGLTGTDPDAARLLRLHHALRFPILKEKKEYSFQLYDLANRRLLWKSAGNFTDGESAKEAFEAFLQLLAYRGNWLTDGGSECGSWGFYLGNVLLEGMRLYPSPGEAWEALKDFLLNVQQDGGINRFKNYAAGCCFALEAVGEAYRLARHPRRFRTFEEREVTLLWLLQRVKCRDRLFSEILTEVKCINSVHYFYLKDPLTGEVLWRSFEGYPSAGEASLAAEREQYQILEWAREPGFYCIVRNAEGKCEVQLVNLERQPVAVVPKPFDVAGSAQRLQAILKRIYHARLFPFLKTKDGYRFQLYDPAYDAAWLAEQAKRICEGEILPACEDTGYRDGCLPVTPEAEPLPADCGCEEQNRLFDQLSKLLKGGVVWESTAFYANRNLLDCAFKNFIGKVVKDPRAYHRADPGDCGPYAIELVDPAERLAFHPRVYPSHEAREDGVAGVRSAIDAEGFHVLEHILLRPFQPSEDEYFVYARFPNLPPGGDDDTPRTELRTVGVPPNGASGASTTLTVQLFDRGFSDKDDICSYVKELWEKIKKKIDPDLTDSENIDVLWNELKLYDLTALEAGWRAFLRFIFAKNLHLDTAQEKWFDHLFACNHGALEAACDLLPICPEGCDDIPAFDELDFMEASACGSAGDLEQEKIYLSYLPGADPYSFWATVVIPFWSRRFLNTNFRTFFEETIRREVPAHVALRILWVNPQQMGDFEHRYRAWLEAKAGLADCDLQKSQRRLIKILLDLKNEYLPARLFDCEAGGQTDVIFLDQTKLG